MFHTTDQVDFYNSKRLNDLPNEKEYVSKAIDNLVGKVSEFVKISELKKFGYKKRKDTGNLPCVLRIKCELKAMITTNIDTQDKLVNGTCGVIKQVTLKDDSDEIDKIWISCSHHKNVNAKARLKHSEFMKKNNIDLDLIPIDKVQFVEETRKFGNQFDIIRTQFSLVLAEAMTIHEVQGQTYHSICLDLRSKQRLRKAMLYVACSRAASKEGLYILGKFRPPLKPTSKDKVISEINRLREESKLTIPLLYKKKEYNYSIVYLNISSFKKKLITF